MPEVVALFAGATNPALMYQKQIEDEATQAPWLVNQLKQHFWSALQTHFDCLPSQFVTLHSFLLAFAAASASNPILPTTVRATAHEITANHRAMMFSPMS